MFARSLVNCMGLTCTPNGSHHWLARRSASYGGSRSPLEDHAEEILAVIEEQPDLTLDEIVAVMRKRQIPGSRTALFRFLERHAVTSKAYLITHFPQSRNAW